MKHFRITKYNPDNRDSEGHYINNEWTCPSEVGKLFNGIEFTKEEYFSVEANYIEAVQALLKLNNINHLRIVQLGNDFTEDFLNSDENKWLIEDGFKTIELYEDKKIESAEIAIIIKMVLRNFISCTLEIEHEFKVYFGWDYYMYVDLKHSNSDVFANFQEIGIYIERFEKNNDNFIYKYYIDLATKEEPEFVDSTIEIFNITRSDIRKGLEFSIEHPCNHNFQITEKNQHIFKNEIHFNFEKYDYHFWCELTAP